MTTATAPPITVTIEELTEMLFHCPGSTFLSFDYERDAGLSGSNPFGPVSKVSRVNVSVGFDYDAGVERRLEKEGKDPAEFAERERKGSWHEPVFDSEGRWTPLCKHKITGEMYLRAQHLRTVDGPRYYTSEGRELRYEGVEPFLPKKTAYENQGLDSPLKFVVYALEKMSNIHIGGETLEVM